MTKLFGNAPTAATPQAAQATAGNIPDQAATTLATTNNVATAPNGVVPSSSPVTKDGVTASPVDNFADLWQPVTSANPNEGQPLFNVSHDKLLATARQQDFRQTVTPEQLQAIAAGGQEAINAMSDMINGATQAGYAQSVLTTTKLIEGALAKSNFAKADDLETRIRDVQVGSSLREENPVFSDPAYAPLLQTAQKQFQQKYPTATAAELKSMATQYLTSMATRLNPAQQTPASKQKQSEDWSNFLK